MILANCLSVHHSLLYTQLLLLVALLSFFYSLDIRFFHSFPIIPQSIFLSQSSSFFVQAVFVFLMDNNFSREYLRQPSIASEQTMLFLQPLHPQKTDICLRGEAVYGRGPRDNPCMGSGRPPLTKSVCHSLRRRLDEEKKTALTTCVLMRKVDNGFKTCRG